MFISEEGKCVIWAEIENEEKGFDLYEEVWKWFLQKNINIYLYRIDENELHISFSEEHADLLSELNSYLESKGLELLDYN